MINNIQNSFSDSINALTIFAENKDNSSKVLQVSELLANAFKNNKKALICGNGGSNCDAMHFAEEFTGKFRKDRKPLPVISLSDPSHITCTANDFGFEEIFSRGVEAYGQPGDIFLGLSTSANSENVLRAVNKAKELGLKTIGLFGSKKGKIAGLCDIEFFVPAHTTDRIQEVHMTILHIVIEGVERILFPENY